MTNQALPHSVTDADSKSASSAETGTGVRDVSVFSSSAGHCKVGFTIPRVKVHIGDP